MTDEKRIKAEMLLDEIGEIDEALLSDALNYRKRIRMNTRVFAMAASIVVIFCLAAGSLALPQLITPESSMEAEGGNSISGGYDGDADYEGDENISAGDAAENEVTNSYKEDIFEGEYAGVPEGFVPELALDSVFYSIAEGKRDSFVTDPDLLPYSDGKIYIVWRYSDEERYYLSDPLSNGEFDSIKDSIGQGKALTDSSHEPKVKVWMLLGDGRVVSPYLRQTSENISGVIFDYKAEIIPDRSFVDKISDILG